MLRKYADSSAVIVESDSPFIAYATGERLAQALWSSDLVVGTGFLAFRAASNKVFERPAWIDCEDKIDRKTCLQLGLCHKCHVVLLNGEETVTFL